MTPPESIEDRIARLQAPGVVDMHFDMPMDLYEKRAGTDVLKREFLADLEKGDTGVLGCALYIEDRYLPDKATSVALGQIARLYIEAEASGRCAVCRSYAQVLNARVAGKIALLITMEGAEPLGKELDLLRIFHELGLRMLGLTHARANAAATGGIFAASGSPATGLTDFGRELVRECERLGIIIDLAHISPAGFKDIMEIAKRPPIISHTNARKFYDVERNSSDEQIKEVAARGGVIGVNSILVSPKKENSTLDGYVDHFEHIIGLAGVDHVGIGFDFFEFIWHQWPEERQQQLREKLTEPHIIPDLRNHAHARNLTRKFIERGWSDENIEKILYRNWMRILEKLL